MSDHLDIMRQVASAMNEGSPQARALGFQSVSLDKATAVLKVPYDKKLVGDPDTGVIAGGVVTTLLDHCCGQAAHAALDSFKFIATLDLRIDYMRAAEPGKDIFARAHCFKVTKNVAFVRAVALSSETLSKPSARAWGLPWFIACATWRMMSRWSLMAPL